MKHIKTKSAGITLIALVITIIVLLILAGIIINLTIGEGGIIKRAEDAGKNYVYAAEREQTQLAEFVNETDNIIENITTSGKNEPEVEPENVIVTEEISHIVDENLTYDWTTLSKIAKAISDNDDKITNDSVGAIVTIGAKTYNVGVGDKTTVIYNGTPKTVRIMGFNHDILTEIDAYGEEENNITAGISFEFINALGTARMNGTDTNENGWEVCELRASLNGIIFNNLSNNTVIKSVVKKYIQTYHSAESVKDSSGDKLWLLSCAEIWKGGGLPGACAHAIAEEGTRYKYYKDINASYGSGNSALVKESNWWWLRSPRYNFYDYFNFVSSNGKCDSKNASNTDGSVIPGFAI